MIVVVNTSDTCSTRGDIYILFAYGIATGMSIWWLILLSVFKVDKRKMYIIDIKPYPQQTYWFFGFIYSLFYTALIMMLSLAGAIIDQKSCRSVRSLWARVFIWLSAMILPVLGLIVSCIMIAISYNYGTIFELASRQENGFNPQRLKKINGIRQHFNKTCVYHDYLEQFIVFRQIYASSDIDLLELDFLACLIITGTQLSYIREDIDSHGQCGICHSGVQYSMDVVMLPECRHSYHVKCLYKAMLAPGAYACRVCDRDIANQIKAYRRK